VTDTATLSAEVPQPTSETISSTETSVAEIGTITSEPAPVVEATQTSSTVPEQTTAAPEVGSPAPETPDNAATSLVDLVSSASPDVGNVGPAPATTAVDTQSTAPAGNSVDQSPAVSSAKPVETGNPAKSEAPRPDIATDNGNSPSQTDALASPTDPATSGVPESSITTDNGNSPSQTDVTASPTETTPLDSIPTTGGDKLASLDLGSLESFSSFIGSAGGSTFATSVRVPKTIAITTTDASGRRTTMIPTFTPLAAQAQAAQDQALLPTAVRGGGGSGAGTGSGGGELGVPTETLNPGLNVIQSSKSNSTQATVAISVSVVVAAVVMMCVGAWFFFRRWMSRRTAHADSPPPTPLIGKFDVERLQIPRTPLSPRPGNEMSEKGFQGQDQTQWAERGNGKYGPEWPLSPLPAGMGHDQGLGSENVGGPRETMRVFPNQREKLGGKDFPSNF